MGRVKWCFSPVRSIGHSSNHLVDSMWIDAYTSADSLVCIYYYCTAIEVLLKCVADGLAATRLLLYCSVGTPDKTCLAAHQSIICLRSQRSINWNISIGWIHHLCHDLIEAMAFVHIFAYSSSAVLLSKQKISIRLEHSASSRSLSISLPPERSLLQIFRA